MIKFDNDYMAMPLDNEAKRVKLIHHIRNIYIDKLLKTISDEEIKKNAEAKHEDAYSFGCSNLLEQGPEQFLSYMFDRNDAVRRQLFSEKKTANGYKTMRRGADDKDNFFVSHKAGQATIIFTSLTNKAQKNFVEAANSWGDSRKIEFFTINGDETFTRYAEDYANLIIAMHPDKHVVFVTNNMASRSFSVPKLANGIMMVNAPGAAASEQKFNRLTTIDHNDANKKAHMYWFNFKAMNLVCPLVDVVWTDLNKKKTLKADNGEQARTMLDAIDIFDVIVQNDETTTQSRWTEKDIFAEQRKNMSERDVMARMLTNFAPELNEAIKEMLAELSDEDYKCIRADKLGKAAMAEIDCGPTFKKNGRSENRQSGDGEEKKHKPIPVEIMTSVLTTFATASSNGYESFAMACGRVIGCDNCRKIGEPAFIKLWKIVDDKIVKPMLEKEQSF